MATVSYLTVDGEILSETRDGVDRDYLPDPLGNTIALLDDSQTKTDTWSYDAWGKATRLTGSTATPFLFVGTLGYYSDSRSQLYVRARYYRPTQGRWMTVDLLWPWEAAYCHVINQPATLTDASGLAAWMECGSTLLGTYTHAFITFNVPCDGHRSCGFWPGSPSARKAGACTASGGISSSIGGEAGTIGGLIGTLVGAGSSSSASSGTSGSSLGGPGSGQILCPDPNTGDANCRPISVRNSPTFEAALCECVKKSKKSPPSYCFPGYVCGSWAEAMWTCATRKVGPHHGGGTW